jgi:hypothetical protein
LQAGLTVSIGDLKLHALEIPMQIPIRIGDTELRFYEHNPKQAIPLEVPAAGSWLTVTDSGQELLNALKKSSQSRLSIYLCGETGTGKEVLAKMVHENSPVRPAASSPSIVARSRCRWPRASSLDTLRGPLPVRSAIVRARFCRLMAARYSSMKSGTCLMRFK